MRFHKTGILVLSVVAACALHAAQDSYADEVAEAGQRVFGKKKFPWFDTASNSITDMKRADPGRAKTLDRAKIPAYVPKQKPATPTGPPGTANSGQPFFNAMVWIVIALVFVLIVGALVWVFLKMERRAGSVSQSQGEEKTSARARIKQLPFDFPHDSTADFRELAARAAAEGNYGRATMLLFSHVLLHLDRKGLIRLKKGKTNRQYLRELQSHSQLLKYYQRVMIPFEEVFFGDHPIQQPVFESCWNDLDSFQELVNDSLQSEPR